MNNMLKPHLIGLLAIVPVSWLSGCTDPYSPERGRERIAFSVSESAFDHGDTVVATLVNRSDREAGYNLCMAELELRTASGWQRIPRHSPPGFCTLILNLLAPGESASFSQLVREELPVGVYRFRTEVEWPHGDHRFNVVTGSFQIQE